MHSLESLSFSYIEWHGSDKVLFLLTVDTWGLQDNREILKSLIQ